MKHLKELRTEIYTYFMVNNVNPKKQEKLLNEIKRKFNNYKDTEKNYGLHTLFSNTNPEKQVEKTKQFWAQIPAKEIQEVKKEAEKFLGKKAKSGISPKEVSNLLAEAADYLDKSERTALSKFLQKCHNAENCNQFTDRFADRIAADLANQATKNAGNRFLDLGVREYLPVLNALLDEHNYNNNAM